MKEDNESLELSLARTYLGLQKCSLRCSLLVTCVRSPRSSLVAMFAGKELCFRLTANTVGEGEVNFRLPC